jgi:hypothetical protein
MLIAVPFFAVLFSPLLLGGGESRQLYAGMILVGFLGVILITVLAFIDRKE